MAKAYATLAITKEDVAEIIEQKLKNMGLEHIDGGNSSYTITFMNEDWEESDFDACSVIAYGPSEE